MRSSRPDSIKAFTRVGLWLYDPLIVHFVAPVIWGCPPARLIEHYRAYVTSNHADIGVGTGYCLDRCGFDRPDPRIALIDLQPNCLAHAARRLARYRPETWLQDARRPMRVAGGPFDSIGLSGVLHCLPGDLTAKSAVFDALAPLTRVGTTVFGCTLLADRVRERTRSLLVHCALNRLRVIDNRADRADDLWDELSSRFVDCTLEEVGCMAFFSGVVAHHPTPAITSQHQRNLQ